MTTPTTPKAEWENELKETQVETTCSDYGLDRDDWERVKRVFSQALAKQKESIKEQLQEENRQRSIGIFCEDCSSEFKEGYAARCNELQQIINNL